MYLSQLRLEFYNDYTIHHQYAQVHDDDDDVMDIQMMMLMMIDKQNLIVFDKSIQMDQSQHLLMLM